MVKVVERVDRLGLDGGGGWWRQVHRPCVQQRADQRLRSSMFLGEARQREYISHTGQLHKRDIRAVRARALERPQHGCADITLAARQNTAMQTHPTVFLRSRTHGTAFTTVRSCRRLA